MVSTLSIPLKTWDGPAGNTMPQCGRWDDRTRNFVFGQADDVAGQTEQNSVFRQHTIKLNYTGLTSTAVEGGHLSSFGLFHESGESHVLMGHRTRGLVSFPVVEGKVKKYTRYRGTMSGTAACSEKHDLLCMRSGDVYEGYTLSSVRAGAPVKLFRTVVKSDWYKRFQGHHITRINGEIVLIIHGDDYTKGPSEMRLLRITSFSKWRTLDTIDTTHMGDEAEGCVDFNDRIYVLKRTANGDKRTLDLTATVYRTWVTPPKPKPSSTGSKADPKAAGTWQVYNVNSWLWGRLAKNGKLVREDDWIQREPGFKITTGHHYETIGGVKYLVTKAGRYYTAKFLRKL